MPVLRTPFAAEITPEKAVALTSQAGPFTLYASGVSYTALKDKQQRPTQSSTLTVQVGKKRFAVATLAPGGPQCVKVRIVVPVLKEGQTATLAVRGPRGLVLTGDQHTRMSRAQMETLAKVAPAVARAAAARVKEEEAIAEAAEE